MKLKALLIAALAAAVAIPTVAGAAQGGTTRDSITGGGQAFFDARDPNGAGDTIAFTAKRARGASTDSTDAEGQIQVKRRGSNAVKFHGEFSCLVVNSDGDRGWAYASGASRGGTPFELFVEDGGKGQLERNDMIMRFYGEDETDDNDDGQGESVCGFSSPDFDTVSMARGNVQARNRSTNEDAEPENEQSQGASQTSALSELLGL